jgi:hypothetical protein
MSDKQIEWGQWQAKRANLSLITRHLQMQMELEETQVIVMSDE